MTDGFKIPPYKDVYKKIRNAGLSPSLIKRVILPSWWDDTDQDNEALCQSAYIEIAAKLGVAYRELINEKAPLDLFASLSRVSFKTGSKNKDESSLTASAHIGIRLAEIIASAYSQSDCFIKFKQSTVEECRQSILTGASWVSFKPLLDFCWRSGIPVVYWKGEAGQSFDGISTSINGIPVIILGSGKNTAWSTFHLAHELGHVMLGHTNGDCLNLDSQIQNSPSTSNKKEVAASNFGKLLLHGEKDIPTVEMDISSLELQKYAVTYRVSPSTLLLSSCWLKKGSRARDNAFKMLTARLSRMKSIGDTKTVVNELLQSKIGHDFDAALSDWQHDFLDALLG